MAKRKFFVLFVLSLSLASSGLGIAAENTLSLKAADFVKLVRDRNEMLQSQEMEWNISQEAVKNARAIFEPELNLTPNHSDKTYLNQDVALAIFGGDTVVDEKINDYSAGVEGVTPYGSTVRVGLTMQDRVNDLAPDLNKKHQYQGFAGINVSQPLLKGAGKNVTYANIRMAENDAEVSFQSYRQQLLQVVGNSLASFWDLYWAQDKLKIREESVKIATEVLDDNRERARTGKMAETEVFEAHAGVLTRKSLVVAARQEVVDAEAKLRGYISMPASEESRPIRVDASPTLADGGKDFAESFGIALERRPEFLASKFKQEKEKTRTDYARNQKLPQLNLVGSYGRTSISDTMGEAFDQSFYSDYLSWSLGVEFKIPLLGGKKAKSELAAAEYRKRQANLEGEAIKVALANNVEAAMQNVTAMREQLANYSEVVRLNKQLLDVEMSRLQAGKSHSRDLLDREEKLNQAKEAELESLVNYQKSLMALDMMDGSLLTAYGVEIMEAKNDE